MDKSEIKRVAFLELDSDPKVVLNQKPLVVSEYLVLAKDIPTSTTKKIINTDLISNIVKASTLTKEEAKDKKMFLLPDHGVLREIVSETKNRFNLLVTRNAENADFIVINEKIYNQSVHFLSSYDGQIDAELIPKSRILDLLSIDCHDFYNKCVELEVFNQKFAEVNAEKTYGYIRGHRGTVTKRLSFFDNFCSIFIKSRSYYFGDGTSKMTTEEVINTVQFDFKKCIDSFYTKDILKRIKLQIEDLDQDYIAVNPYNEFYHYLGRLERIKQELSILNSCKTVHQLIISDFLRDEGPGFKRDGFSIVSIFNKKFENLLLIKDNQRLVLQTNINSLIKTSEITEADFLMINKLFESSDKSNHEMATNLLMNVSVEDNLILLAFLLIRYSPRIMDTAISKTTSFKMFSQHYKAACDRFVKSQKGIRFNKLCRLSDIIKNAKSYYSRVDMYILEFYDAATVFYKGEENIPKFITDDIYNTINNYIYSTLRNSDFLKLCDIHINIKKNEHS